MEKSFFVCFRGCDDVNQRTETNAKRIKTVPLEKSTVCPHCRKPFSRYDSRLRHERICAVKLHTNKTSLAEDPVGRREQTRSCKSKHKNDVEQKQKKSFVTCHKCKLNFNTSQELYAHRQIAHEQSGGNAASFQREPWTDEFLPPWVQEDGSIDEQLKRTYDLHRHLILRRRHTDGPVRSIFNFPIANNVSLDQLMEQVESIYQESQFAFKINLSFGIILQHIETEAYRYFVPYHNENIFSRPILINNRNDILRLRDRLARLDITNYILKQRPDTKWKPVVVTNVRYDLYKTSFVLGLAQNLPNYLLKSKSVICFEKNPKTHERFDDNLCFFRCLAYHKSKSVYVERMVRILHAQWVKYVEDHRLKSSDVSLSQIPDLEQCFEVNLNVYSLSEDYVATVLYKSLEKFSTNHEMKNSIYLNMYEDHLMYISKFDTYCSKFSCRSCSKLFSRRDKCEDHSKTCEKNTKIKFPGGYYSLPKNVFELLAEIDIIVDKENRQYPYFMVFDFESMLVKQTTDTSESKLTWIAEHKPVSVSICSNVRDFEDPKFILDSDLHSLLSQMVDYMYTISDKCYSLAKEKWHRVFLALDQLEAKWPKPTKNDANKDTDDDDDNDDEAIETQEFEPPSAEFVYAMNKENVFYKFLERLQTSDEVEVEYNDWDDSNTDVSTDNDDLFIEPFRPLNVIVETNDVGMSNNANSSDNDEQLVGNRTALLMHNIVHKARDCFETYCRQVPTIGFNSSNYDLNLVKTQLASHLGLHLPGNKFIVKKNNSYMCLSNDRLKFLDMTSYLPPGTSYDNFLKSFKVQQGKGYFPYEYFDDISRLDDTTLPPKESFYSSLKDRNVLENDTFTKYHKLIVDEDKSVQEALNILRLKRPPKSSEDEMYSYLLQVWQEENMLSFRDFLMWYNNLDVVPFVEAIEAFKRYFLNDNIDVFKNCISIPGAARQMLFETGLKSGASFALIDVFDKDLYDTIKDNIIGGPSIIFTRKHKVGQTYIRDDPSRPCQSIVGYDANSLYLFAICQPMLVHSYTRRLKASGFKPSNSRRRYKSMYDWLEWLNYSSQANIKHKLNNGVEKRVGPYLVDGFDPDSGLLYEFYGCYYHGCPCSKQKDPLLQARLYDRTIERLDYIRSRGFEVETIWECEYHKQLKENRVMKDFVLSRTSPFHRKYPGMVSQNLILEAVMDETLFGMLEVDIEVPDTWDKVRYKPDTTLSPYDYFEEFCPLFCTTEVPFDVIGQHMQDHIAKHNLSRKPRTLLVGGMKAKKLLLATPLLKWYIEHGLLVCNIYQVVEFGKLACFKEFGDKVTKARREGDIDKDLEVKALIEKLKGNSAFGGTIMNKEKFTKIKYVQGFRKACLAVNNPRFRKLNELNDEVFETESFNSHITMNLPIQLGYMILQYAKLHMLSFYFDFLMVHVDKNDFEFLQMDTDSAYFALSAPTLFDAIKPSKKAEFYQSLHENCSDNVRPVADGKTVWFPRECCSKHKRYDSRTGGLMKLECHADHFIGLCSKAYLAVNSLSGMVKYSLKGVNKNMYDPSKYFEQVLKDKNYQTKQNKGIRVYHNQIFSYQQIKCAFTYLYCKREILSDGLHSKPLKLTLQPRKKKDPIQEEEI